MLQKKEEAKQVPSSVQTTDDQPALLEAPNVQPSALLAKVYAFTSVMAFCLILAVSKAVVKVTNPSRAVTAVLISRFLEV